MGWDSLKDGQGLDRRRELLKCRLAVLVHAKPGDDERVQIALEADGRVVANVSPVC